MNVATMRRRRSDHPEFTQVDADIQGLAEEIFRRYAGDQPIVIDGSRYTTTFFNPAYCPDFRVMKLAGALALATNRRAAAEEDEPGGLKPMRVTIEEIMLAALLHDLGKHHEDCAPFLQLFSETDLRGETDGDSAARKDYLLSVVRDVHCRKGPCMIDRLRDAGRPELNNPFIVTVARRHGDDYEVNRARPQGCWWPLEVNVITIADDYDAMTSEGPERAYKQRQIAPSEAAARLRAGAERGRYEPRLTDIFIADVLGLDAAVR